MSGKIPISVSWSGGKDSAYALWLTLQDPEYEVVELHTLINEETQRVGLHGIRKELIQEQADQIGLPVHFLELTRDSTNDSFEKVTAFHYQGLKSQGIRHVMFGDIFLEDLKRYRDQLLKGSGLQGHYPIWKSDTRELAHSFIDNGFKTTICAANPDLFHFPVAGQLYTQELLSRFPMNVDPCGENGEFHSFVHQGPIFHQPIRIVIGELEVHEYEFKDDTGNIQKTKMEFVEIQPAG